MSTNLTKVVSFPLEHRIFSVYAKHDTVALVIVKPRAP